MNSKEAIDKIRNLLFGAQKFGYLKTIDGVELQIEGDVELTKEIYVITPDGNIPAEEGEYQIEDGMVVKVKDGLVESIEYAPEEEITTETTTETKEELEKHEDEIKMVSAELIDGTIVETDSEELKVGDTLFIITEEGRNEAPTGDHETTDGKIVSVEDGVITDIKEKEIVDEVMTESLEELLEVFTAGFNHLSNELGTIKSEYDKLKDDFKKFSSEPAGERQYFQQEYVSNLKNTRINKLESLRMLKKITKNNNN